MALRIIITGGTFDKQYDVIRGQLTFKDSHLPEIIEQVRSTLGVELEINQLVDSLDMQDDNRQRVLAACRRAPSRLACGHERSQYPTADPRRQRPHGPGPATPVR